MTAVKRWLQAVGLSGGSGALPLAETALSAFALPALVVDGHCHVLSANPAADSLSAAVADGRAAGAKALVERALASGEPQTALVAASEDGGMRLYDLAVLPTIDGRAVLFGKDVTLEGNLRASLMESRQRYKDLVEISSDFAWELGADGRFDFVSAQGALGYTADQLVGHDPAEFLVDQPGLDGPRAFRSDQPSDRIEVWMRRADGQHACLLVSSLPLTDERGRWCGARGVCREVTAERERKAALARANNREQLLNYVVRTIRDVVDPAELLTTAAEATAKALGADGCQIFRQGERELVPAAAFDPLAEAGPAPAGLEGEERFKAVIGPKQLLGMTTHHRRAVNGAILVQRNLDRLPWGDEEELLLDEVANQIGIAIEQLANHERILMLSRTDALTGLFNRRAFFEELTRRFGRLARDHRPAALIYVDLDNFKLVNDAHGHQRGDEALLAVRDILAHHSRAADLVARLGGDEFALWLEGTDEAIACRRAEEIVQAAACLAEFSGDAAHPLSLSLGLAVHRPERPESLNDLLSRADAAMYAAKREGKGAYRLAPAADGSEGRG